MPDAALVSIHPQHVRAILGGGKRVEFRKVVFRKDVKWLAVYATAPVSAVVAIIEVDELISGTPDAVWDAFSEWAGIDEAHFRAYYGDRNLAVAIKLASVQELSRSVLLEDWLPNVRPPQSFLYLAAESLDSLREAACGSQVA